MLILEAPAAVLKQKDIDFHANVQVQVNELRSLFHASVLLLTMHFVIALKK